MKGLVVRQVLFAYVGVDCIFFKKVGDIVEKQNVWYTAGEYSGVNFNLLQKEFENTLKSVYGRMPDDIFMIEFHGHRFNCLPFLLNGSGFYNWNYRHSLNVSVARHASRLTPFGRKDLENIEGFDWTMFMCMIPSYRDMGVRDLGLYLYSIQPNELACCLIGSLHQEFYNFIIKHEKNYLSFKYKDIANTQAFCFFIGFLWIMKFTPVLKMYIGAMMKREGMTALIDSFMPENCIHYKYITGEYTSKDLLREYNKPRFEDGTSIALREMLCLTTDGAYDGRLISEYEKSCIYDIWSIISEDQDYRFNMNLAYCVLYNGSYDSLQEQLRQAENITDRHKSDLEVAELRLKAQMKRNTELNSEVQSLKKEIQRLNGVVSKIRPQDEYIREISSLKNDIVHNENEINRLFKERLELKRELSQYKKQLRNKSVSTDNIITEVVNEKDTDISFDEIIDYIKDKRIAIVGGIHINGLDERLKAYGVVHVKHYEENVSKIGVFDIGIIISNAVKHADVYKFEKECKKHNTQIIYFSGTNIERMIREIYNAII